MLKYEIIREPEYIILKKVINIQDDVKNSFLYNYSLLTLEDGTKYSVDNDGHDPIRMGDMVAYDIAADQVKKINVDRLIAENRLRLVE